MVLCGLNAEYSPEMIRLLGKHGTVGVVLLLMEGTLWWFLVYSFGQVLSFYMLS